MRLNRLVVCAPGLILLLTLVIALGCNKKPTSEAGITTAAPAKSSPAASSTASSSASSSSSSASGPEQEPATVSRQNYTSINGRPLPEGYTYTGPVLQPPQQWKPYTGGPAPNIPFAKGLLTTGVITGERFQDIERYEQVTAMDATSATVEEDQEIDPKSSGPSTLQSKPSVGHATRIQDLADYASSNHLMIEWKLNGTVHFPGSTYSSLSAATMNLLKAGQPAPFQFVFLEQFKLLGVTTHHYIRLPTEVDWGENEMFDCVLHRVEPNDLAIPVIVNGVPIDLPALHARCTADSGEVEDLFLLDQPSNAIVLASQSYPYAERSQVIKINYVPEPKEIEAAAKIAPGPPSAGSGMEKKLANKEPVEVYGIYFDFNSANIRPQSEDTLKMISDILHKNPTWKLALGGHTDNIGGDDFNLTLSKARSAAVKQALIAEYKIAPDRLSTDGFGATKPVAPNDTVQGRALNRRVELQRSN